MKATKNDHTRSDSSTELTQMKSINGNCKFDKSYQKIIKNIQCQSDSNNEVIFNVAESSRYQLAEVNVAVKHVEYTIKVFKNIIDQHSAKPDDYEEWTDEERYKYLMANLKTYMPSIPDSLLFFILGAKYRGDCGRESKEKPIWLDMEKFCRGQRFAQDYMTPILLSNILSLLGIFAFEHNLKPLILSKQSHTPHLAFKRYTSTLIRLIKWMTEDLWNKDTAAYRDIQVVRRMHRAMRLKLCECSNQEIDANSKILNPHCPDRKMLLQDLSSCSRLNVENDYILLFTKTPGLNQAEMAATQFAFMGLIVLYPHEFGIDASDEDLEAFCHMWRSIGYLLGIMDEFNFCRGSLEEIKERGRDFINIWMKPYLRQVTPEWEHMMRCIVNGFGFMKFKVLLLFFTEILDIDMPRTRSALSYLQRFQLLLLRFTFRYAMRLRFVRICLNKMFMYLLHNKCTRRDPEKLERSSCPGFSSS